MDVSDWQNYMRKWHIEELHDLYSLPNIIQVIKKRRIRLGARDMCRRKSNVWEGFSGRTEGTKVLGRHTHWGRY